MSDVTRLLSQLENGDASSAEELLPLVYDELRKPATARLNQEKPGQTLQATALVHEAYMRFGQGPGRQLAVSSPIEELTSRNQPIGHFCKSGLYIILPPSFCHSYFRTQKRV